MAIILRGSFKDCGKELGSCNRVRSLLSSSVSATRAEKARPKNEKEDETKGLHALRGLTKTWWCLDG